MQDNIATVFSQYIKDNDLTQDNYNAKLHEISYITFFNDITSNILGAPLYTHDKCPTTTNSIVYIADSAKEMFISGVDILTINSLYHGAITRLEYNYPNYPEFLNSMFSLRKKMKKKAFNEDIYHEANLTQTLIKIYLNLVYGMIDNAQSILTSAHKSPRSFIVESSRNAVLSITSFLINKGVPVYYIDTDEIHCGSISLENYAELQEFYNDNADIHIDTTISTMNKDSDGFTNGYYKAKKQFVLGDKTKMRGLNEVNDTNVKFDNKKYFGGTFPHQFPEYAI